MDSPLISGSDSGGAGDSGGGDVAETCDHGIPWPGELPPQPAPRSEPHDSELHDMMATLPAEALTTGCDFYCGTCGTLHIEGRLTAWPGGDPFKAGKPDCEHPKPSKILLSYRTDAT